MDRIVTRAFTREQIKELHETARLLRERSRVVCRRAHELLDGRVQPVAPAPRRCSNCGRLIPKSP